jgi:hypothetical protein
VFAYDRETREPVWQAGLAKGASRARDMWVLGLGPFESRGAVRKRRGLFSSEKDPAIGVSNHAADLHDAYAGSVVFQRALERPTKPAEEAEPVQTASHEEPARIDPPANSKPAAGAQ